MQIHIAVQGEQQGPFDLDTLNQRIANGSIQPVSALAWYVVIMMVTAACRSGR
jgi:GYF domain 2